ncbi:hypothetical protein LOAG_14985 [Loa loa]|uniref:Uncharacterized protein n=1 Tax=Loa loa TaxID=7209 RepID=A0A1S0TH50_LOALO|nr:hypothetical protein LOAG_14985 [Loa loa]EFO13543.1 hypothetical protein LOAG_14985 [Loa loa]
MTGTKTVKVKQKENFVIDLPTDSNQASNLDSAINWFRHEIDEIEARTMREIPLNKLLSFKKSMMPLERNHSPATVNIISNHSISITGDEKAQSFSDESVANSNFAKDQSIKNYLSMQSSLMS